MQAYRRAALTLHALEEADRDWLLEQLPEGQGAQLRQHLADLVELGIPTDRGLVNAALNAARKAKPSEPLCRRRLRHASCEELMPVLENEPDRLLALLLKSEAWPWRDALLGRLDSERRHRVSRLLRQVELKSSLEEALLAGLVQRLGPLPPVEASGPTGAGKGWGTLLRIRSRIRRALKP